MKYLITLVAYVTYLVVMLGTLANCGKPPVNRFEVADDKIIVETAETSEKAVFESETAIVETLVETIEETEPETGEETGAEAETEPETETEAPTERVIPHYSNDGDLMPIELQDYIWECLEAYGRTDVYEYLLAIAYRESSGNPNCVTKGKDFGLFQYRAQYWPEWCQGAKHEVTDIMDAYAQIEVTVYYTVKRLNKGKSIEEVISDHYSGEGWYDARYVALVMINYRGLVRI